jgi:GAF domain-containing protein/HAMP domain-containing protein
MKPQTQNDKMKRPRTKNSGSISLRTKLIIGNMLIIILAITGTGYYVYSRSNSANTILAKILDKDVLQQAEDELNFTSSLQATELNNFFILVRRDINTIGSTTTNLLVHETTLDNKEFWNASQALGRLSNGSWDNSNYEPGSVFLPANKNLSSSLETELNTIKKLDLTAPGVLKQNPDAVAVYFGGASGETLYYPNIDLASIVPPDFDVTNRPWYLNANKANNPNKKTVWSAPYLDAALHGLVVTASIPVYDSSNSLRGVAAMDIQLKRITDLVSNIKVGKTGYALLVDKEKRLIALPEAGYKDLGISSSTFPLGDILDSSKSSEIPSRFFDVLNNTVAGKSGLETLSIGGVERFIAFNPISEVGYGLVIIVPSNELLVDAITTRQQILTLTTNTYTRSIILVALILLAALIITITISNSLTSPLRSLTHTAEDIMQGNLSASIAVQGKDEIGKLALTLNTMTNSLRDTVQSLEQKVDERTRDQVRKSLRLQAASQVAHDAAEYQDINQLINRTVELISSRFGYYHTGIFLLDDSGEHAVLRAASSLGGQKMLARGHQLDIGVQGIVGAAAYLNRPRIAMDVAEDREYYKNPDLPQTRSEAAFPLSAHGKVLGVLDIQSIETSSFQQDDVEVLQTMADQIGLAIQNARLISESQTALQRLEITTAGNIRRLWREYVQGGKHGYRFSGTGLAPITEHSDQVATISLDSNCLNIPIQLRGQSIGTIVFRRITDRPWGETERSLATEISNQIGLALENARLLDEAQRRAAQETSLSELSTVLSHSLDPDVLLRSAIRELHHLPNISGVSVFLTTTEITAEKDAS